MSLAPTVAVSPRQRTCERYPALHSPNRTRSSLRAVRATTFAMARRQEVLSVACRVRLVDIDSPEDDWSRLGAQQTEGAGEVSRVTTLLDLRRADGTAQIKGEDICAMPPRGIRDADR